MAPYVSKYLGEAYVNYKDLDLGKNNQKGKTSYKQENIWGAKYFKKTNSRDWYKLKLWSS